MNPERMFDSRIIHAKTINRFILNSSQSNYSYAKKTKKFKPFIKRKRNIILSFNKEKVNKAQDIREDFPKENKKSKLSASDMLKLFLKNSSIFALNRIGKSNSTTRRAFWVFVLCLAVAGCVFHIGQFLTSYHKYPVVINLESEKERSLQFPAVTLCNLNSILRKFQVCIENSLSYNECFNSSNRGENVELRNTTPTCNGNLDYYKT